MKKAILAMAINTTLFTSCRMGDDGVSLELSYASAEAIPEGFASLYTESNGAFALTKVNGIKTQADIERLTNALTMERNDHSKVKQRYAPLNGLEPSEILTQLDSIPALKLAAEAAGNTNIDEAVAARLEQSTAPLARDIATLTSQLQESQDAVKAYVVKETRATVAAQIRTAAVAAKMLPEAIEDVIAMGQAFFEVNEAGGVVAKNDINGLTPGVMPQVWLTEMKNTKPFYWPASTPANAGGGGGGGGANPFSKDGWNQTEQGKLLNSNRAQAEQLAAAAGTTIGGPRPDK